MSIYSSYYKRFVFLIETGSGSVFADFLKKNASKEVLKKLSEFDKLDEIRNLLTRQHYQGLGYFSGATMRYIAIAEQIKQLFCFPENTKIVEIVAGFGEGYL